MQKTCCFAPVLRLAVRVRPILFSGERKTEFCSVKRLTELLLVHLLVIGLIMLPISARHFRSTSSDRLNQNAQLVNGRSVEEGAQRKNRVTKESCGSGRVETA